MSATAEMSWLRTLCERGLQSGSHGESSAFSFTSSHGVARYGGFRNSLYLNPRKQVSKPSGTLNYYGNEMFPVTLDPLSLLHVNVSP